MKHPSTIALPLFVAALLGAGCVDMMVGNGPSGMSFTPPPTQPEVWPEPLPMESIVGKWASEATSDYFLFWTTGWRRVMSFWGSTELTLNGDGTCALEEEQTVRETHGTIGFKMGTRQRLAYRGTWAYGNGELRLTLSLSESQPFPARKARPSITQEYAVAWHSQTAFSLLESPEQFKRNAVDTGFGPGWNPMTTPTGGDYREPWTSRKTHENGMVELFKREYGQQYLHERIFTYRTPFTKASPLQ